MVCMLRCFGACAQRAGDKKNSTLEKERVGAGIGPTALGRWNMTNRFFGRMQPKFGWCHYDV